MRRHRVAAIVLALSVVLGGATAAEEFYTLASVQAVSVRGGTAIRLMANGPLAYGVLPDADVPAGLRRIRLRLYGINAVAQGALQPLAAAGVSIVPDPRGNLDVTITAASGGLDAARPFEVRTGRGAQEIDVILRAAP